LRISGGEIEDVWDNAEEEDSEATTYVKDIERDDTEPFTSKRRPGNAAIVGSDHNEQFTPMGIFPLAMFFKL